MLNYSKYYIIFFFSTFTFPQYRIQTGIVADEYDNPLESANIIAKPIQEKATLKFAIADNKGRYKLELVILSFYSLNFC